jgi:Domain of unknown function (DUF397)
MDLTSLRWRKSSYSGTAGGNRVEVATVWRKSSYSGTNGGACVEVATVWEKSSYSGSTGGACVEVARNVPQAAAVRDSKDPDGPRLVFTPQEWREFTAGVRTGEFRLG